MKTKMTIGDKEIFGTETFKVTGYLPKGEIMSVDCMGRKIKGRVWIDDKTFAMKIEEVDQSTETEIGGTITIE